MTEDAKKKTSKITPDDIVFTCMNCGKSLVIDARGAGYEVKCPDCGANLRVPSPDGEGPAIPEEATKAELREALAEAYRHIGELKKLIREMEESRAPLEKEHAENVMRVRMALTDITEIHKAAEDIKSLLEASPGELMKRSRER